MSLSVSLVRGSEDYWGKSHVALFDVTMDSSYNSGGETVTPSNFLSMKRIDGMIFLGGNTASRRLRSPLQHGYG
jgi:hypothetical protein